MTESTAHDGPSAAEGVSLALRPLHGPRNDRFELQLDADLLALRSPDGRLIMMLPREDAARHIRFDWDLPRGRVVSFVVEGLRAYRFRCERRDVDRIVQWLPQKPQAEMEQEVRRYGVALVLLGTVQLFFQAIFFWGWGLLFVFLGLACILYPRRGMYALNAVAMLVAGLVVLFTPHPAASSLGQEVDWINPLRIGLGSLLVVWSVQQFSLLSVNNRLLAARGRSNAVYGEDLGPSALVRKVAWGMTALAGLFLCQIGGLLMQVWVGEAPPRDRDWILCIVLSVLTALMALTLRWYRRPAYFEAKLAGWTGIVLAMLYLAGALTLPFETRLPFCPDIMWVGMSAIVRIYVWGPMLLFILLFNRWFSNAMEKELEQAGE
jgi:hypothetical protein